MFITLFNMSVAASWLILAVVLLRVLLRKAPKFILCLLWALVALRLLCPFTIESVLSLVPSAQTINPDIAYSQTPAVSTGFTSFNSVVNPVIQEALAPNVADSVNPAQIWLYIANVVWLVGAAGLAVYALVSWLRLRGLVCASLRIRENIYICDDVKTPFILGVFKPRIYLPSDLDDKRREYVVAHENAHISRRDHWWKPLGYALLTVYWFNPVIWLAYILLCRDIELACDERVVKNVGVEEKKEYSDALLACSAPHRSIAACPLAFGEVGVKSRVRSILSYKKPAFWLIVASVVASVAVGVCFLTSPKKDYETVPYDTAQPDATVACDLVIGRSYRVRGLVYLSPLSSYYPMDGDPGIRCVAHADSFVIEHSPAVPSEVLTVDEWAWQEFPFTDEQWSSMLLGTYPPLPDYENGLYSPSQTYHLKLYQPLSSDYSLFRIDDRLWLARLSDSSIWSIYELQYETARGTAEWSYNASLSGLTPFLEFESTDSAGNVNVVCEGGSLNETETAKTFRWTPLGSDSTIALSAKINFSYNGTDGETRWGTLCITARPEETANLYAVYTISLGGSRLWLSDVSASGNITISETPPAVDPSDTTQHELKYEAYISYVGSSGAGYERMVARAENENMPILSLFQSLPLARLENRAELDEFCGQMADCFSLNEAYDGLSSFSTLAETFDEAYFDSHTLMVIYVIETSCSIRHDVDYVVTNRDSLSIGIRKLVPDTLDLAMAGWFVSISLDKAEVAEFDGGYAILSSSVGSA